MAEPKSAAGEIEISRDRLAELLNEDLSREYQAVIAYVVYSQVLKGAEYMAIAAQLEIHAKQELDHALILARQIDYLGKMPVVVPKPVRTSENAKDMLRYDLDNENETIRNYRDRIPQCEALGEYAMAEQIRQILMQEQDHQIDLATALGIEVPDVGGGPKRRAPHARRRRGRISRQRVATKMCRARLASALGRGRLFFVERGLAAELGVERRRPREPFGCRAFGSKAIRSLRHAM
jgi:bacterioferritin